VLAQLRASAPRREHFAWWSTIWGAARRRHPRGYPEEIVGDIEDEHDIEVPGIKAEPDGQLCSSTAR